MFPRKEFESQIIVKRKTTQQIYRSMTQTRQKASLPRYYKPSPPKKYLPADAPRQTRRRITPFIIGGLCVYLLSTYATYQYTTLSRLPLTDIPQDADTSSRYDVTAPNFDGKVSFTERYSGIDSLRKKLTQKARGHVLETSVGTGRNAAYYDLRRCKSLTFVDQSPQMIQIARDKFHALHPSYNSCAFYTQSALLPLPTPAPPHGYDTILQSMGLCSTPQPSALLAHMATLVKRDGGRILLLEHGRSYYDWVNWLLDRTAGAHAVRHGCWWNRDIGKIIAESGLVVAKVQRKHLGTMWVVELRRPL